MGNKNVRYFGFWFSSYYYYGQVCPLPRST
mgnify:FL=1